MAPVSPFGPCGPVAPVAPRGIVKLNTAALAVPAFLTDASLPASPVVTVPTLILAASPVAPFGPCGPVAPVSPFGPCGPVAPVAPRGIVKLNTAALAVPAFLTDASLPASPVVTVPTLILAASPVAPFGPCGPVAPVSPFGPCGPVAPVAPRGIVKLNTAALAVPAFLTDASLPASPVVTVPTLILAASPVAPFGPCGPVAPVSPFGPWIPCFPCGPVGPAGPVAPFSPAGPCGPVAPVAPFGPCGPVAPHGIVISNTAAFSVPELVTLALLPSSPVVTFPILMVAAFPTAPVGPCGPVFPCGPCGPAGPVTNPKSTSVTAIIPSCYSFS